MVPVSEAAGRVRELVSRACERGERVLLSVDGAPVAAIVSVAELDALEAAVDQAELELCRVIKATSGGLGIPHEEAMALLAADDAEDT